MTVPAAAPLGSTLDDLACRCFIPAPSGNRIGHLTLACESTADTLKRAGVMDWQDGHEPPREYRDDKPSYRIKPTWLGQPTHEVMPTMKAAGPDSKVNMSVECWRPDSGHRAVVDEDKEQTFSRGELRLIGQGAEAEIFEWQDGRVLKLLRARGPVERVEYEVAALDAARSAGLQVPQAYEQVVVDGRPGIVMERLRGPDLFSMMGRKPWLVFRAGRLTGETHARINAVRGPASLPKVKDVAEEILASLGRREPAMQLAWIGPILARLPDGEALCHGDFHPGQLMVSDGECVAFDWPGAKRGDPLFDYARTRVLLTIGEPPPGTPLLLRFLAKVGRRLLVSSCARSYERNAAEPVDQARVREWEVANLAVRLFENIPGERPRLLRRLRNEIS